MEGEKKGGERSKAGQQGSAVRWAKLSAAARQVSAARYAAAAALVSPVRPLTSWQFTLLGGEPPDCKAARGGRREKGRGGRGVDMGWVPTLRVLPTALLGCGSQGALHDLSRTQRAFRNRCNSRGSAASSEVACLGQGASWARRHRRRRGTGQEQEQRRWGSPHCWLAVRVATEVEENAGNGGKRQPVAALIPPLASWPAH